MIKRGDPKGRFGVNKYYLIESKKYFLFWHGLCFDHGEVLFGTFDKDFTYTGENPCNC